MGCRLSKQWQVEDNIFSAWYTLTASFPPKFHGVVRPGVWSGPCAVRYPHHGHPRAMGRLSWCTTIPSYGCSGLTLVAWWYRLRPRRRYSRDVIRTRVALAMPLFGTVDGKRAALAEAGGGAARPCVSRLGWFSAHVLGLPFSRAG